MGDRTRIVDFANNALTSPEMLQKTYLDFISRESSLRESKSKMRSSNYSLVKRVSATGIKDIKEGMNKGGDVSSPLQAILKGAKSSL